MTIVDGAIQYFENYAGRIFSAAGIILILEWIFPQSRNSFASRIRGAVFWLVYIVINAAAFTLFWRLWNRLGLNPVFHVRLSALSSSLQRRQLT